MPARPRVSLAASVLPNPASQVSIPVRLTVRTSINTAGMITSKILLPVIAEGLRADGRQTCPLVVVRL